METRKNDGSDRGYLVTLHEAHLTAALLADEVEYLRTVRDNIEKIIELPAVFFSGFAIRKLRYFSTFHRSVSQTYLKTELLGLSNM